MRRKFPFESQTRPIEPAATFTHSWTGRSPTIRTLSLYRNLLLDAIHYLNMPNATRKLEGYEFYRTALGSPKCVVAPMVDQSELVRVLFLCGLTDNRGLHCFMFNLTVSYVGFLCTVLNLVRRGENCRGSTEQMYVTIPHSPAVRLQVHKLQLVFSFCAFSSSHTHR